MGSSSKRDKAAKHFQVNIVRIAIFSDVHSNLEALNAVLNEIRKRKPDRIFFLGDAVGYGADPNECMEKIFEVSDMIVAGNHDHAAVGLTDIDQFNPLAAEAILWTRSALTSENRDRLLSLPMTEREKDLFLVHASPDRPQEWSYISSMPDAAYHFDFFEGKICLVGHTHRPAAYFCDGNQFGEIQESVLTIEEKIRYIVNVGSVGQPRDRNPDAVYVLYDTEEEKISFVRVKYNFRITQDKMRAHHLPSFLIERLEYGI